jgi:hypothetical protein
MGIKRVQLGKANPQGPSFQSRAIGEGGEERGGGSGGDGNIYDPSQQTGSQRSPCFESPESPLWEGRVKIKASV